MSRRPRGTMVQRSPGRWLLRVYLGRSPEGKRRYSAETFTGTTTQAKQRLTALIRTLDTHSFVERSKVTLAAYLDTWLRGRIDITPASRESYGRMQKYFSSIGHLRLFELSKASIQGVLTGMIEAGKSRRTAEYARAVLHAALEAAIETNLLARNPADHTKLPPKFKRPPSVWSMPQVHLFLEGTKDHRHHAFWTFQFSSGLRPEEAYALRWSDLDLEGMWVSVRRVIADQGKGRYQIVESPKTDSSIRRLGLPASTIETLKAHKKAQAVAILAAGTNYERQDLVFCTSKGTLLDPSRVRREFKAAIVAENVKLAKAGRDLLPEIRHYDTRHSHLTALLADGADISWVKARAGHANISTTIDNYAHVMQESHREMGERTEKLMQQSRS